MKKPFSADETQGFPAVCVRPGGPTGSGQLHLQGQVTSLKGQPLGKHLLPNSAPAKLNYKSPTLTPLPDMHYSSYHSHKMSHPDIVA